MASGHISKFGLRRPFTDSDTTVSPDRYTLDPCGINATSIAVIDTRQVRRGEGVQFE